jgi:glycosyltransferase involved in cell wall biosynthesis
MIGIGITTRNRREVAQDTINRIRSLAPKGSKIVIVDDASDVPYPNADYRFPFQAGIARAKNKCLELLRDCDYIFLFDDDCFPVNKEWADKYIESGLNHASFNFLWGNDGMRIDRVVNDKIVSWSNPRGSMLFLTKQALEKAGGMDEGFAIWGYEHPDLSRRIFNLGLTPCRFPDVVNSHNYFYSYDMESKIRSTVPDRRGLIDFNRNRYVSKERSTQYVPFMANEIPLKPTLLTCYFNGSKDPQRGHYWSGNMADLKVLIDSCNATKTPVIIFHDCLDNAVDSELVHFRRVAKSAVKSPLAYRWIVYRDYLEKNAHEKVFCIDSTDVKVLKNPFNYMESGLLYVGDEIGNTWENEWVRKYNEPYIRIPDYKEIKEFYKDSILLNAGLIGGDIKVIKYLCDYFVNHILQEPYNPLVHTDVALINYFARRFFSDSLVHGEPVNTKFKQFESNNQKAWFCHK